MTDYYTRIDPKLLYPPFWAKSCALQANCLTAGVAYYATSGFRSVADQDALYAQGRTKPGKVVTNARGGQSYHNFGLAIDWCRDADMTREGLQPDWDPDSYETISQKAPALGLESGLHWKFRDAPHVQLNIESKGITLPQLDAIFKKSGLPGVWKFLDSFNW